MIAQRPVISTANWMIGYWVPSWNYYYHYEFEIILMYGLDGTCTLSMCNKRW